MICVFGSASEAPLEDIDTLLFDSLQTQLEDLDDDSAAPEDLNQEFRDLELPETGDDPMDDEDDDSSLSEAEPSD